MRSSWRISIAKSVESELDKLPAAAYREALDVLRDLRDFGPQIPGWMARRGHRDTYRVRIHGRYRMVYRVSWQQQRIYITRTASNDRLPWYGSVMLTNSQAPIGRDRPFGGAVYPPLRNFPQSGPDGQESRDHVLPPQSHWA